MTRTSRSFRGGSLALFVLALASPLCAGVEDSEQEPPYEREESEGTRAVYTSFSEYLKPTPPDTAAFVERLAESTNLPRRSEIYPIDRQVLQQVAAALTRAASEQFSVTLSVDDPDPEQLDRLIDEHLIDPALRRFFGELRGDLSEEEQQAYHLASERNRVPDEPLLYYALGAYWGEWLTRHRGAKWALYEPLRPVQSFADFASSRGITCTFPFSHVVKKLGAPESDSLAPMFFAAPNRNSRPILLLVSPADVEHAVRWDVRRSAVEAGETDAAGKLD